MATLPSPSPVRSIPVDAPCDLRGDLGDFSSIVCFRALLSGVENILGKAAYGTLVGAGRQRGHDLVGSLGLKGAGLLRAQQALDGALGPDGTRLCRVVDVDMDAEADTVTVRLSETIEGAGEPDGSDRRLTYTAGAIRGAVEALSGRTYRVQQTGFAPRGDAFDVLTLTAKT